MGGWYDNLFTFCRFLYLFNAEFSIEINIYSNRSSWRWCRRRRSCTTGDQPSTLSAAVAATGIDRWDCRTARNPKKIFLMLLLRRIQWIQFDTLMVYWYALFNYSKKNIDLHFQNTFTPTIEVFASTPTVDWFIHFAYRNCRCTFWITFISMQSRSGFT